MSQEGKKTLSTESIKAGKVLPKDMVTVWGTDSTSPLKKDKAYKMHRVAAEKLIAKGHALIKNLKQRRLNNGNEKPKRAGT